MISTRRSIKAQFGAVTGLLIIFIVATLSVLAASKAEKVLEDENHQAQVQQTKQSYELLDNFLASRSSNIDLWASDPLVAGVVKNEALRMVMVPSLRARFAEIRTKEPWLEHVFVLKGTEVVYDDSDRFEFLPAGPEALQSLQENRFNVLPIEKIGTSSPQRLIVIRKKVNIEDGPAEPVSMVVAIDPIKAHASLFGKIRIGKRGFISLVSSVEGKISEIVASNTDELSRNDFHSAIASASGLDALSGSFRSVSLLKENHPEAQLAVVGVASRADIREPIENLIRWFVILGLLISAAGVAVAVFFSGRLSRPIERLTAVVQELAQGKLDARSDVQSENEVGVLSHSFNSMASELQNRIADVEFLEGLSNSLVTVKTCADLGRVVSERLSSFLKAPEVKVVCQLAPLADDPLPSLGLHRYPLHRPSSQQRHGFMEIPVNIAKSGDRKTHSLLEAVRESSEMAIENICSLEDSLKRVAIETEMKTAHAVQECLFTERLPKVPGYEMEGYFTPAAQLGGDWYGIYFDETLGRIRIYIGDVTGHGVSSALITAGAMAVVHTIEADVRSGLRDMDLEVMLKRLHGVIRDVGRNRLLMTFCICELEIATGKVNFINAGHNAPFIVTKGKEKGIQYLMAIGNRLGYTSQSDELPVFKRGCQILDPGEILVLYTDGLIEARNAAGKEFGIRNLQSCIIRERENSMAIACESTIRSLDQFRDAADLADDVSLVLIKRHETV